MSEVSAQVVTLEASVRVLTVGNRQITQSVANQLDEVELWRIEPMGRVKIKGRQLAIGRHKSSGDLSLASEHNCHVGWHLLDVDTAVGELENWTECVCGCKRAWRDELRNIYNRDFTERRCRDADRAVSKVADLPLIVLAGLR